MAHGDIDSDRNADGTFREGHHPPKEFTSDSQPTNEAKSRGKRIKRQGRELVQHILSMPFKGTEEYRQKIAEYFGIDPNEITNEEMILFKQAEKAMKTGDSRSAELLLDRAHGKPVQSSNVQISGELNNNIRQLIRKPAEKKENENT